MYAELGPASVSAGEGLRFEMSHAFVTTIEVVEVTNTCTSILSTSVVTIPLSSREINTQPHTVHARRNVQ